MGNFMLLTFILMCLSIKMIVLASEPLQHCLLMSTKENIKKKKRVI